MIPIKDDIPTLRISFITYLIIIANVIIFGYEYYLEILPGNQLDVFIGQYALVPAYIVAGQSLWTLVTSMFLHAGFMHIAGNMLFLYIFGNNVEDNMGHFPFLIFYMLCGFAASGLQIFSDPTSTVINLGASGAIAGVLGAYLILYPRARIYTVIVVGFIFLRWIPALLFLPYWFIIQLAYGIGSLFTASSGGGVAFWAHVGGFVSGLILVLIFRKKKQKVMTVEDEWDKYLYGR